MATQAASLGKFPREAEAFAGYRWVSDDVNQTRLEGAKDSMKMETGTTEKS